MASRTLDSSTVVSGALLLGVTYLLGLVFHRLFLSPLAKFPGPKLAAATHLYQKYFDLLAKRHGGQFPMEIKRMHEKYGPIVRIAPDELHIDDPEYWQEVYCSNSAKRPTDKPFKAQHRFGLPDATFSTPEAEVHRLRRQAIAPFFSRQHLRESQDRINQLVERMSERITKEYAGKERVLDVSKMLSCLAADVVTEVCFRRCTNCIEAPDFSAALAISLMSIVRMSQWNANIRSLIAMVERMPRFIVAALVPRLKPIMELRVGIKNQVTEVLSHADDLSPAEKDSHRTSHDTLFDEILASKLPRNDLTLDRLSQEAMALTAAGVETVKSTITLALFHSLANPSIALRLKSELTAAIPDPTLIPSWLDLEKLPYLSAVINEGFRLNYGTVQRSPRINRLHPMHYHQWLIPPGTAVGMDSYHMHTNAAVFPEPFVFRPERWLGNPKGPNGIQPLTNYLTTFGGGSRMCVAMNLAYLENFVTLAVLFRRHEMRLWETEREDVEFAVDMITPMPHPKSRGVRVVVGK